MTDEDRQAILDKCMTISKVCKLQGKMFEELANLMKAYFKSENSDYY